MFSKKCDKKSHPYLAVMIGALAVVGAFAIKKCSMDFVKSKWCKLKNSMKNMNIPICNMGDECGE